MWSFWTLTTISRIRLVVTGLLLLAASAAIAAPPVRPASVSAPQPQGTAPAATAVAPTAPAATPAAPAAGPATATGAPPLSTFVSMDHLDDQRLINIGDQISFRVVEDRDPPVTLMVTHSGEIEFPYIGRVDARGKTCRALAYELKEMLEKDFYYKATVVVAMDVYGSQSRGKVYLVGQVMRAGAQDLPLGEKLTVSRAILNAGGMGDFAEKRRVKLVRKKSPDDENPETIYVDVKRLLEEGKAGNDPELQDGDLIIVDQRLINF